MPQDTPRDRVKLHIRTQLDASKQFLVVLIGLAVTNAVAEKLKYSIDGSGFGLIRMIGGSVDPAFGGAPPRFMVAGNDELYDTIFNGRSNYLAVFVLLVFFVYTTRFFFNNYTYLSQIYGDAAIGEVENDKDAMLSLKYSSSFDLALSVFTGIVVCLISMVLTPKRIVILLAFLMLHYLADAFVLGFWAIRTLRKGELSRKCWRAICWIINNIVFCLIFAIQITSIVDRVHAQADLGGEAATQTFLENKFWFVASIWLANCLVAFAITWWWKEDFKKGDWPSPQQVSTNGWPDLELPDGTKVRLVPADPPQPTAAIATRT